MSIDIKETTLSLNSLHDGIPALTPAKAEMLKESVVYCLKSCEHVNGVQIDAQTSESKYQCPICWEDNFDMEKLSRAYNSDDAIEFGAEGLSFLLVKSFTEYTAIRRAVTGTGIDYWLGRKDIVGNNIFTKDDARLEVSGIMRETKSNSIKKRVREKLKQTKPTDHTFPVIVSVVEFGQPQAEMVRKNVQS